MKRLVAVFLFLFLTLLPQLSAGEVQVTANFDKRAAQIGEEIQLTIRITDAMGNIQAPRLPGFQGFDTFYTGRSSHITFINGQSSSSVEFSYVLVPKQAGHFKIDPIEVNVESKRFMTEPVEIDVQGGSAVANNAPRQAPPMPSRPQNPYPATAPVNEPTPANFKPDDDNIFVRAWTDKTEVYPNEQILLTYSLYTRYDTRYEGFEKEPQVSGFWIEEFPMGQDVQRETVRMNGKKYIKADIRKTALFATAPAEYTIDPGTLKASIRQEPENNSVFDDFFNDSFFSGGGFFARREDRILKPSPIMIHVKPFPETDKPAAFQGAVGNFRMTATLDKQAVKQNEPLTMKLVIEGQGNIETLNKPKMPELQGVKIYDSDTSSQLFKTGDVIGGRKVFEVVFIPSQPGDLKIPPVEFSFFNPAKRAYEKIRTPEFLVPVTPSGEQFKLPTPLGGQEEFKKEVRAEAQDIRFIKEDLEDAREQALAKNIFTGVASGSILLTLLVGYGLLRRRREKVYASNTGLKRRSQARSRAEGRMKKIKALNKAETAEYFEEIEKILTQYLSDKFNLSTHGVTRWDLEKQLEQAVGPEDPLLSDLRKLYEFCDESRFGKGTVPEEMKKTAFQILQRTLDRVEKMKG